MTPRQFRLAAVLRLRKRQQDQAAAELGAAAKSHADAQDEVARQYKELTDHGVSGNVDPAYFRSAMAARASLCVTFQCAQAVAAQRHNELLQAQQDWIVAKSKTQALERLESSHHQQRLRDADKKLQNIVDEQVSFRYNSERPTGEDRD